MNENSKLIKDVDAVQRFRDILFYELRFLDGANLILLMYLIGFINQSLSFFGLHINVLVLALSVIAIAAILFTPYIFYVLIIEKKYGWIITFFAMIILPLLFAYIIFRDALFFEALMLLPIGSFYFYCYLIKFEVDKWLADYSWHQERLQQKKETEDRIKSEMIF
ncbi:MAG: hypothetical protein IT276_05940 [Ignavibacteriaceae bacterium]|nr:hypothetical protein [Ignavibacterium sp.]MCC6254434.1 hypothetical protein [Ignavibacteriaceae bacterium]HRN27679.1 hypothetical protein [Ignavibacteriaceae bacterium]HRQ55275.1 hypothetical protein [Ignavibacteriaceae bacterium]